jgi:phosphopantetheinyl transferase
LAQGPGLALARRSELAARWPEPLRWLTASEDARRQGFSRAQRREAYVAGRWLGRELMAQCLGESPASLDLAELPDGWQLSLSHSGDWVAAAAQRGARIGLDLETAERPRDWAALARFIGLQGVADETGFLAHWTLCEAWLKAQPDGVRLPDLHGMQWQPDAQGDGWQTRHERLHLHLAVFGAAAEPEWQQAPPGWTAWTQSTPKSK